jgi:hypothetical protein
VLLAICGAVIAALALVAGGRRRWLALLLIPIMVVAVIGGARHVRNALRFDQPIALDPHNYTPWNLGDYADAGQEVVPSAARPNALGIKQSDIRRDRAEVTASAGPGEIIYTNIMTPPQLIDVEGAQVVGRWEYPPPRPDWQPRWYIALRVDDGATSGKAHITIREARSLPIVSGWIISILGLLGLAANGALIGRRAWRRR